MIQEPTQAVTGYRAAGGMLPSAQRRMPVPPLASFTAYHLELLNHAMKGELTRESLEAVDERAKLVQEFYEQREEEEFHGGG